LVGAVDQKVGERRAVVIFEAEAYPEPKALNGDELENLLGYHGNSYKVSEVIGASEAFVRLTYQKECSRR
jgi:hypothetical protein